MNYLEDLTIEELTSEEVELLPDRDLMSGGCGCGGIGVSVWVQVKVNACICLCC
jgi:hypothetical protein